MHLEISVENVPERDRFELWRATIFDTLAISAEPMPDAAAPFRAHFSARSRGPLLNCRFDSDGFHAVRQSREIAHKQWDGYRVYRENSVGVWFRIGGQELLSAKGDLIVADADALFEAHPSASYSDESWMVPKALIDPHLPATGQPLLKRLSGHDGVEALAAVYLEGLTRNWDSIPVAAMGQVTDSLSRLIGIACGADAAMQTDAVRTGRLAEARRYIDRRLADPELSPAGAAVALGVSVRTLHELFEPTGRSFARHVQRRRLEECRAALLASPTRPVIDIALAWGFSGMSTFYRAFREAFAMSPRDLREASLPARDL